MIRNFVIGSTCCVKLTRCVKLIRCVKFIVVYSKMYRNRCVKLTRCVNLICCVKLDRRVKCQPFPS